MNTKNLGNNGEDKACVYLSKKGYDIITRNYYSRYGEIDIVAKDNDYVVFVEVKTRKSIKYGRGVDAITPNKIQKLRHIANEYIQNELGYEPKCRFDVIDILILNTTEITHIENAF